MEKLSFHLSCTDIDTLIALLINNWHVEFYQIPRQHLRSGGLDAHTPSIWEISGVVFSLPSYLDNQFHRLPSSLSRSFTVLSITSFLFLFMSFLVA